MKPQYGQFLVTGKRPYRDHPPGTEFVARLERNAKHRAIARGDIRLIRLVEPSLQPGSFTYPRGWLKAEHTTIG